MSLIWMPVGYILWGLISARIDYTIRRKWLPDEDAKQDSMVAIMGGTFWPVWYIILFLKGFGMAVQWFVSRETAADRRRRLAKQRRNLDEELRVAAEEAGLKYFPINGD